MITNQKAKRMNLVVLILFAASAAGIARSGILATTRTVDVLQLFAAGILFGVLIRGLVSQFGKSRVEE